MGCRFSVSHICEKNKSAPNLREKLRVIFSPADLADKYADKYADGVRRNFTRSFFLQ